MNEKRFKKSVSGTLATGIILEKELSTDEVFNELIKLEKENKDLEEARSYYQENFLTMKTERNQLKKENKELKLQLEAFKDKLCELGVSDVKLYGKRYYTGLEEWLND